jgi:hypothetical protein
MHADKMHVFNVNICDFLSFVASNQQALTPVVPQYFLPMLPMSSSCFGMILDEGGGGAPWPPCLQEERGVVACSLCLIVLGKNICVKKSYCLII